MSPLLWSCLEFGYKIKGRCEMNFQLSPLVIHISCSFDSISIKRKVIWCVFLKIHLCSSFLTTLTQILCILMQINIPCRMFAEAELHGKMFFLTSSIGIYFSRNRGKLSPFLLFSARKSSCTQHKFDCSVEFNLCNPHFIYRKLAAQMCAYYY